MHAMTVGKGPLETHLTFMACIFDSHALLAHAPWAVVGWEGFGHIPRGGSPHEGGYEQRGGGKGGRNYGNPCFA